METILRSPGLIPSAGNFDGFGSANGRYRHCGRNTPIWPGMTTSEGTAGLPCSARVSYRSTRVKDLDVWIKELQEPMARPTAAPEPVVPDSSQEYLPPLGSVNLLFGLQQISYLRFPYQSQCERNPWGLRGYQTVDNIGRDIGIFG